MGLSLQMIYPENVCLEQKKVTNFPFGLVGTQFLGIRGPRGKPRPLPAEPSTVASPAMSGWLLINVDEAVVGGMDGMQPVTWEGFNYLLYIYTC